MSAEKQFAHEDRRADRAEVTLKFADGHTEVRAINSHFKQVYTDEYTNEPLDHHLVKQAMLDELKYFCENNEYLYFMNDYQCSNNL